MTSQVIFSKRSLLVAGALGLSLGLSGCGDDAMTEPSDSERAAMVERIKPSVALEDLVSKQEQVAPAAEPAPAATQAVAAAAPAATQSAGGDAAKPLYDAKCMMCHSTGAAGAPKIGEAAAWQPRVAVGIDGLVASAKAGKGAMPPNGGSAYSEDEMRQVIEYMLAGTGLL